MRAFISSIALHALIFAGGFFSISTATSAFVLPEDNSLGVRAIEVGLLNLSTHNERKAGSSEITSDDSTKLANSKEEIVVKKSVSKEEIKAVQFNKDVASLQVKANEVQIPKESANSKEKTSIADDEIINQGLKNTPKNESLALTVADATSALDEKTNPINQSSFTLPHVEQDEVNGVAGSNGLGTKNIGKEGHTSGNNLLIDSGTLGYSGRLVRFSPPKYPERSRRASEEGYIEVEVFTDGEGEITQIALLTSSGFDSLDDAALKSVKRARFTPVAGRVVIPIVFALEN